MAYLACVNNPYFNLNYLYESGDQYINGIKTFDNPPIYESDASGNPLFVATAQDQVPVLAQYDENLYWPYNVDTTLVSAIQFDVSPNSILDSATGDGLVPKRQIDSSYFYKTKNDVVTSTYTFEKIPKYTGIIGSFTFPTGFTNKQYVDGLYSTLLTRGGTSLPSQTCASGATVKIQSYPPFIANKPVILGGNVRFTIPDTAITIGAYIQKAQVILSQSQGFTQAFEFNDLNVGLNKTNVVSFTIPYFYSFISNGESVSISATATTVGQLSSIIVNGGSDEGTHVFSLELL